MVFRLGVTVMRPAIPRSPGGRVRVHIGRRMCGFEDILGLCLAVVHYTAACENEAGRPAGSDEKARQGRTRLRRSGSPCRLPVPRGLRCLDMQHFAVLDSCHWSPRCLRVHSYWSRPSLISIALLHMHACVLPWVHGVACFPDSADCRSTQPHCSLLVVLCLTCASQKGYSSYIQWGSYIFTLTHYV
ncbi:uncharacterized protein K452DRAFT_169330 [Aplosporella prunicola CBS 121167]|uniref:Uncharacterized protein n=1 Tax=Aplosporella prunicola CBS 121167 TaxID=1176127 RepID=A0A6A6BJ46_9PEZI|nr:uncharacterized protein K452DRAFT_169330 [Aplosporella prunicola CBS 121167]KAF2143335.1 hypothetical protein K452DRAFT_169330 [Aplosporella prunicola CBS 121167]